MLSQTVVVMDTASLGMVHVARVHAPSSHPQLLHRVCKLSVEPGEGRRAVVTLPLYLHASCYTECDTPQHGVWVAYCAFGSSDPRLSSTMPPATAMYESATRLWARVMRLVALMVSESLHRM